MTDREDRKALEQELRPQIGTADWPVLQIHAKSGNMIVLNQTVDLLNFAIAVAANDTEVVSKHIQDGSVSKPSAEEQARFKERLANSSNLLSLRRLSWSNLWA